MTYSSYKSTNKITLCNSNLQYAQLLDIILTVHIGAHADELICAKNIQSYNNTSLLHIIHYNNVYA